MPDGSIPAVLLSFYLSAPCHAHSAEHDERYAKQLSHVQYHVGLEGFLYIFGVLDEETESEYVCETKAEEEACAHLFGMLAV